MPGAEKRPITLFEMTKLEYYVRDRRMMVQGDGPRHTASLGIKKEVVNLDAKVEVIDNDVVDRNDEKNDQICQFFLLWKIQAFCVSSNAFPNYSGWTPSQRYQYRP